MATKKQQFVEKMKRYRDIDFARIGMKVEVMGEIGTIKGINDSANLDIVFANQLKMGSGKQNCHPTWDIKYFNQNGKVIAEYGRN